MFEVGFTELLLIFALALVVLGPRRLPELASRVGRWVGKARAMARQLRDQLDQEVNLEETEAGRQRQPPPRPMTDLDVDPHGQPYYPPDHHSSNESGPGEPSPGDRSPDHAGNPENAGSNEPGPPRLKSASGEPSLRPAADAAASAAEGQTQDPPNESPQPQRTAHEPTGT